MTETYSRDAVVDGLPSAQALIDVACEAMRAHPGEPVEAASQALDRWAPAIDQLADTSRAAAFLGYTSPHTVKRKRWRTRADGSPEWPKPEPGNTFGRSPAWPYRAIILHLAQAPGRGHPGMTLGRTNADKRKTGGS